MSTWRFCLGRRNRSAMRRLFRLTRTLQGSSRRMSCVLYSKVESVGELEMGQKPSEEELIKMITEVDSTGRGAIGKEDFLKVIAYHK